MIQFRYTGMTNTGKKTSGHLEANDEHHAKQLIRSKGLYIVELNKRNERQFLKLEKNISAKPQDISIFAIELAGLLKAGAPLRKALEIQSKGNGKQAHMAANISTKIDNGGKLSEGIREIGLSAHLLAEFAAAGENGAGLDKLLENGGEFIRARHQAITRIKNALAYPLFILVLAFISMSVLTIYVAPALAPTLESSESSGIIFLMADLGEWIQSNNSFILVGIALLILVTYLILKRPQTSSVLNKAVWKIPYIGTIAKDLDIGQSCEVLSALLESGRPVDVALEYASAVSGPNLSKSYKRMSKRIRDGSLMSTAFEEEKDLPIEVKRLALLGEQTSALGISIKQAGVLCYDRALLRIDRFSAIAGPSLVIIMGIGIALLMLNVLGSISQIGDVPI